MENLYYYTALSLFCLLVFKHFFHHARKLPPSPFSFPIIGHLHLIKKPLHRSLGSLSSKYGPILYLRLGCRSIVTMSSPSTIEECFTKNDIVFANRPRSMSGDLLTYNYSSFLFASYGDLWRSHRRLAVAELFSSKNLRKSCTILEEETCCLVRQLFRASVSGNQKVDLKFWFSVFSFNNMMKMITGEQCIREKDAFSEVGMKQLEELKGKFYVSVSLNMCDFFPILRRVGYKWLEKSLIMLHEKRDVYWQGLVDEFRQKRTTCPNTNTVTDGMKTTLIETLLSLQESEPDLYSDDVIKGFIQVTTL